MANPLPAARAQQPRKPRQAVTPGSLHRAPTTARKDARSGWPDGGWRAQLIDTRLVRAELARLRAPQVGTELHGALSARSSIRGRA